MRNIRTNAKQTLLSAALCACMGGFAYPHVAHAQATEQAQSWQIAAGPLEPALRRVMTQGKLTISYSPELVAGKKTRGLSGAYAPAEALRRLLDGTGLAADAINGSTFALHEASPEVQTPPPAREPKPNAPTAQQPSESETKELDTITVTGTRIRGAQPSSPVMMISQEEMRLAGHNNLGEVIRALPQNFSGGQNPGVTTGAGGGIANQNVTGSASLNLRGLGPDATLTLLNGVRLPYDSATQATDITVIPVAAIDRFEVLLDGASAVYGSDAVGGVANVVLKRDYDGAELTARYGEATAGGYEQTQISAVVGHTWATGNLLVAAETTSSGDVLASQRDYLDYISNPDQLTLYPKMSQHGVLVSGHQKLGERAELALDAFYTKRSMETRILQSTTTVGYNADTSIYGFSPSIRIVLPNDWSMRAHGFIGEDEAKTPTRVFSLATGAQTSLSGTMYQNQTKAAGVEFEGALFALPGGDARTSIGGGWQDTGLESSNLITGNKSYGGSNSNRNLYGEIYLPLIGETQDIPLVNRLSLNGAVRYDDYDRFGGATTPKIGVLWNVVPSLDIRASWGKSFKAPLVLQQFQARGVALRTASAAGVTGVSDTATVLTVSGGNPDLEPERAKVTTAGLVFRPSFVPGATIEVGWFDIDYKDRVTNPISVPLVQYGQILDNPAYTDFIIQDPTQAQVEETVQSAVTFTNSSGAIYDPSNVVAIFQNNYFNASSQRVRGVDLDIRYALSALNGTWSFNAGGSWITDSQRKNTELSPAFDTVGEVSYPPKFKGRVGANWSRTNFSIGAIVNRIGGVKDTRTVSNPMRESMTTVDVVFDYAADPAAFAGIGFNLSIMNAFNARPPYVTPSQPYYVDYDSTNYSALGRVVSLAITKRF